MASAGLEAYGWDDEWADAFAGGDEALAGGEPGRVVRVDRGWATVITAAGTVRAQGAPRGVVDAEAVPATGDWVSVVVDPDAGEYVGAIAPRRSSLRRRGAGEAAVSQVLAANVDTVGVVHGLDRPLSIARIERFVALAFDGETHPVVVLAKADLVDRAVVGEAVAAVRDGLHEIEPVVTSVRTDAGLDELSHLVVGGRTLAFIGPSGVGKSSLVNALVGEDVQTTGQVREGDAKGRHTTITRDLVLMPGGGCLVDTPGLRGVGLWFGEDGLEAAFADIEALAQECQFRDCRHDAEPGCAAVAAVAEGRLDADRFARWKALRAEIESAEDARVQQSRRPQGRRPPRRRR